MKQIKTSKAFIIQLPPDGEFEEYRNKTRRILLQEEIFDEKGHLQVEKKYDYNGDNAARVLYSFDERGLKISEESYDADENLEERLTFEYNDEGRVVKGLIHYVDGSFDTIVYEYNVNNELVSKKWMNDDGETERVEEFEYKDGRLIANVLTEEGEEVRNNTFKYNEKGDLIEAGISDENGDYRETYEYDEQGNLVKTLKYDEGDKLVEKVVYGYDEYNNRVSINSEDQVTKRSVESVYHENVLNSSIEIEYNNLGQLTRRIERQMNEHGHLTEMRAFQTEGNRGAPSKYMVIYEQEYY